MHCTCQSSWRYVDFRYEIRDQNANIEDHATVVHLAHLCSLFTLLHYFQPGLMQSIYTQNRATRKTILNRVNKTGVWIRAKSSRSIQKWARQSDIATYAESMQDNPSQYPPLAYRVTKCPNVRGGYWCIEHASQAMKMVRRWENRGAVWIYGWSQNGDRALVEIPGFQDQENRNGF